MPTQPQFAALNASLNAAALVLLIVGYVLARRRKFVAHGWVMASATIVSAAFLAFYLLAHALYKERSSGLPPGWLRTTYYLILFPHILAAMLMLVPIGLQLWRAYTRSWEKHRRLGPWVWGVWVYVSLSGVVVYLMLYHLFPALNPPAG